VRPESARFDVEKPYIHKDGNAVWARTTVNAIRDVFDRPLPARYRLPAVYWSKYFATFGGVMSYSIDEDDQNRRAAAYVDRILKGAKPTELAIQQSKKFEFVLNLRTAKGLGLSVPPGLLALADKSVWKVNGWGAKSARDSDNITPPRSANRDFNVRSVL
jgi:hypothetical protein